ncbi:unnamed protein product [Ectocarpus sp. 4 AP-2014]
MICLSEATIQQQWTLLKVVMCACGSLAHASEPVFGTPTIVCARRARLEGNRGCGKCSGFQVPTSLLRTKGFTSSRREITAPDVFLLSSLYPCHAELLLAARYRTIPLHRAAAYNHQDIASLLLEKGADIEARDGTGQTPLFWACKGGHGEMITLLLSKGAHINAQDTKERTPLHEAARHGKKETCALLLKRGAKRDTMDVDANEPGEDSEPNVPESVRSQIRSMIENS